MVTALYGGSFDPIHLGHLSVVENAAATFDAVAVVVLGNSQKTAGMFSPAERADLVRGATAHLDNVTVHRFHGLIVDAACELGAGVLLRSSHKEGRHERAMAATNQRLTGIRTFFVISDPGTVWISSTMVRELVAAERLGDVESMVPGSVMQALR